MIGLLLVLAAGAAQPSVAQSSPYFLDMSTVAEVYCIDRKGELSSGTAFYLGSGEWMTAGHVVANEAFCSLNKAKVQIEKISARPDFAIIHANSFPLNKALISCERMTEGDVGFATGFAEGNPWPVTTRMIAGIRDHSDHSLEVRGSLVPGMSGGPVVDSDGVVHAINTWQRMDGIPGAGITELADTPLCSRAER